jgi:hypothetical protein
MKRGLWHVANCSFHFFFVPFFFVGSLRVMPGVELENPRNLSACVSTDLARGWFYKFLMKR